MKKPRSKKTLIAYLSANNVGAHLTLRKPLEEYPLTALKGLYTRLSNLLTNPYTAPAQRFGGAESVRRLSRLLDTTPRGVRTREVDLLDDDELLRGVPRNQYI